MPKAAKRPGLTQALGVLMLHVEHRKMFSINGLIDDFVIFGKPSDYIEFARAVDASIRSGEVSILHTATPLRIEINSESELKELMTSLQNQSNQYLSMDDWERRDILRLWGSPTLLEQLRLFLVDLAGRGEGYSYLSEYSETHSYDHLCPVWRLHVL